MPISFLKVPAIRSRPLVALLRLFQPKPTKKQNDAKTRRRRQILRFAHDDSGGGRPPTRGRRWAMALASSERKGLIFRPETLLDRSYVLRTSSSQKGGFHVGTTAQYLDRS